MDPLTVLSVAGSVVQFADFGMKLFADGRELYKSTRGILTAHEELELVTVDLRALFVKVARVHDSEVAESQNQGDQDGEASFQKICSDTIKLAEELIDALDKLKLREGKNRIWESFRKVIESAWSRDQIKSLSKRLVTLRRAAETHTLFSIKAKLNQDSLQASSQFSNLDQKTQLLISSLLEHHNKEDEFEFDIRDKLNSILELVRRIDAVNSVEHRKTRALIVDKPQSDPKRRPDPVAVITAEVELLSVSDEQELILQNKVQEEIIHSLTYPEMTFRYERILEAYPTTFEWVFRDPTADQLPWSNFSEWLETGNGVYWVHGKAGSGKSTLMKHIFDSQKTRKDLATWASTPETNDYRPLCFATFFFWNSGTPEQKSRIGLLRSLLYQVLRTCPNLVPVILPDAWAIAYSALIKRTSYHVAELLTQKRLMVALRTLVHQTRVPLKLCFLVDGLDEFEGSECSHQEIADLFKEITKAHNVKVCLSSRPWVVFSENFKGCPNLRLQDLTRPDITRYVNGKFGKSEAFCTLRNREPEAAQELITEVIEKADGVFLWVQIVVASLLKGIQNRDDMEILHQRLRCMPKELEPLYRHLLSLIEPVYLPWASKAFQIVRAHRDNFLGVAYPFEITDVDLTILTLRLAITEGINVDIKPEHVRIVEQVSPTILHQLTDESLLFGCENTKVQLTARCAGLLEVPEFEQHGLRARIEYLHRTARDFMENEKNWQEMLQHTSGTVFHPEISILRACLLQLGIRCSFQDMTSHGVCNLAYCVLLKARKVDLLLQQETRAPIPF